VVAGGALCVVVVGGNGDVVLDIEDGDGDEDEDGALGYAGTGSTGVSRAAVSLWWPVA